MAAQSPGSSRSTGSASRDSRRRASREETTARILDAAQELFSARNPCDVTVRQIAEKAGVTHALVHQYVGTKDELLSAVIQRTNRAAIARESSNLDEALQVIVADILANRLHSKTMVRSAMDGVEYVSLNKRIETGQALIELARKDAASGVEPKPAPRGIDPRVVVAAMSSLALGWVATEDWNWHVFGIDPSEKDEVFRQLLLIVGYVGDLVLLPEDEPSSP